MIDKYSSEDAIILRPGTKIFLKRILSYNLDMSKILEEPKFSFLKSDEKKGRYVAIEGIDGSGKTTIAEKVCNLLMQGGKRCILVREPWTLEIKKLLENNPKIDPVVEAFLFATDRMILNYNVISNALKEDTYVISDRCYLSSLVYQYIRGAEESIIFALNSLIIKPDAIFLLDVSVEIGLKRLMEKKKRELTHLEGFEFLKKVKERYLEISNTLKDQKIFKIDGEAKPEEISEAIFNKIIAL
ncbi:dTMP kinase [Fervidicoccus fontis]|uniref:Probable thymidylate kinase n=1 Tax=Fervidicoccus fontis TaxID=683846 RepID=A0A7C2ZPT8_9CREN|nr:dTMP kinase [Fervidicoccus fontis]HEW63933.1 dTMP kinase [Fervidicoccus fontis]